MARATSGRRTVEKCPQTALPGAETGLEDTEEIVTELCAEIFDACHAESRVPSGAIPNLYAIVANCTPDKTGTGKGAFHDPDHCWAATARVD